MVRQCMLGENNVGNLDFTVFVDRIEFRRSTQSATGKIAIRIQESQSDIPVVSEQFKKFITGKKIDTRINYGQTKKEMFHSPYKIMEVNYENIPRVEFKIQNEE